MSEPIWIERQTILLLQEESLARHGGSSGIRDMGLLESAMARPQNLFAYEGETDLTRLAAAYAFGLARNHPFVDGNKRAAFAALGVFLLVNGQRLVADRADATLTMVKLAAGHLDEAALASWIRANLRPR